MPKSHLDHSQVSYQEMKFGEYLKSQKVPDWQQSYLDYDKLKKMISELEESKLFSPDDTGKGMCNEKHHFMVFMLTVSI